MKHQDKKHFDVHKPRQHGPDPTSKPIIVGHHPMMPDPMIREERQKTAKPIKVTAEGDEPEPLTPTEPEKPAQEPPEPQKQPDLADISAPHEASPVESAMSAGLEPAFNRAGPALTPSASMDSVGVEPHPGPEPPTHTTAAESAPGAVFPPSEDTLEKQAGPSELKAPQSTATAAVVQPQHTVAKEPITPTPSEPPAGQELHIPAGHAAVHHKPRIWVWGLLGLIVLMWVYAAVDVLTDIKLPYEFFKSLPQ